MLAKLLLLSVVVSMVAVPVLTARDRSGRGGLMKAVLLTIAFNVLYFLAIRFVYPHLLDSP